jgi:hypothetical protein
VWEKETLQEKRDRKVDLNARNALKEKSDKQKEVAKGLDKSTW